MKPNLLIVDDDEDIRTQMKWALTDDYTVQLAEDRPQALDAIRVTQPDVVLLDLGLPPTPNTVEEGMELLQDIKTQAGAAKVIVLSGQGEKVNMANAIGAGAYDFLNKPVQTDELQVVLKRATYVAQLEQEFLTLQRQVDPDGFENMLGSSPAMNTVFHAIRKVATTDASVLLLGESGTGKEMAANAIHRLSRRKDGPFISINCSAIPESLVESELFGHEKGAFTGAHTGRTGRLEAADHGTLFLDEIGDLPPLIQVKILRFLQDQTFERVGGRETKTIDARIFAATNVDLKAAIQTDAFREDLFYRLAVIQIRLPALREREGDIPLLAKAFVQRYAREYQKSIVDFDRNAMTALLSYTWPGNIREMENRIKRAVIMADTKSITAEDLELGDLLDASPHTSLREAREMLDREMVEQALLRHGGKISRAAADLSISRPTLYDLMAKLGIERPASATRQATTRAT